VISSLRKTLGQLIVGRIVFRLFLFAVFVLITGSDVYGAGHSIDVTKFGAVAELRAELGKLKTPFPGR
jgi:Mn2+/Fe2+ NRAMP family transporter